MSQHSTQTPCSEQTDAHTNRINGPGFMSVARHCPPMPKARPRIGPSYGESTRCTHTNTAAWMVACSTAFSSITGFSLSRERLTNGLLLVVQVLAGHSNELACLDGAHHTQTHQQEALHGTSAHTTYFGHEEITCHAGCVAHAAGHRTLTRSLFWLVQTITDWGQHSHCIL